MRNPHSNNLVEKNEEKITVSGALGMPEHMFWGIQTVRRLLLVQHHPEGDEGVEDLEDEGGVHQAIVVELGQEPDHAGPPLVVLLPVHLHPHPYHAKETLHLPIFIRTVPSRVAGERSVSKLRYRYL